MSSSFPTPLYQAPVTIRIPSILTQWPWPRSTNPYHDQCESESCTWFENLQGFSHRKPNNTNKCYCCLLASLAYSRLSKDGCRVACDLMHVFFAFDDCSDLVDEFEARQQADIVMDALRNPEKPRPEGEWFGGEAFRHFQEFTDAVVQQSSDRTHEHIRDDVSYFEIRRQTIGTKPSFIINEARYDLPDYVFEDPVIQSLEELATDMVAITNDLYSYNVEQSCGQEGHNLVTVVMKQYGLDIQKAFNWVANLVNDLEARFLSECKNLPDFPSEGDTANRDVVAYVDDLGRWVRANDEWSFEIPRYFGTDGLRVQKERVFELLPKRQESQDTSSSETE